MPSVILLSGVELGPGERELGKKQKRTISNYLLTELTAENIQPKIPIFILEISSGKWQFREFQEKRTS